MGSPAAAPQAAADPSDDHESDEEPDVTFETVKFARQANLSFSNTERLLALLELAARVGKPDLQSAAAVNRYVDQLLLNSNDGWEEDTFTITSEHVPQLRDHRVNVRWFFRNSEQWLVSQCGNPAYDGSFVLRARKRRGPDGQRIIRDPHTADAWLEAQATLRERLQAAGASEADIKAAVIAALQLTSDKTLLNVKGLQAYPVRACLLNLMYGLRIDNIDCLAYFPVLKRPPGVSSHTWRLVRLFAVNECLRRLLAPLKQLANEGKVTAAPSGALYRFFPRLLSYVADDPEVHDISCILSGGTLHPCEQCWELRDNFDGFSTAAPRTTGEQKELRARICAGETNLIKEKSTHPIASGLWAEGDDQAGWEDNELLATFGFESMHNDDLGVFLDLVELTVETIRTEAGRKAQ
ncbi:hypothetical protein ABPG75_006496 [Micractinium tetrahymenae]